MFFSVHLALHRHNPFSLMLHVPPILKPIFEKPISGSTIFFHRVAPPPKSSCDQVMAAWPSLQGSRSKPEILQALALRTNLGSCVLPAPLGIMLSRASARSARKCCKKARCTWGVGAAVAAVGLGLAGMAWLSREARSHLKSQAAGKKFGRARVKWHVLKELAARQGGLLGSLCRSFHASGGGSSPEAWRRTVA